MGVAWKYTPPTVNKAARLAELRPALNEHIAAAILAESQPLVPVESGDLRDSGKVTMRDDGAAVVSYDAVSEDDYEYGIRQHEDMELNHPNGGQAKFLEQPFHDNPEARLAEVAALLRAELSL